MILGSFLSFLNNRPFGRIGHLETDAVLRFSRQEDSRCGPRLAPGFATGFLAYSL